MNKYFDIDETCGECLVKHNCNEKCETYMREHKEAWKHYKDILEHEIINHILNNKSCPFCNHNMCINWVDYNPEGDGILFTLESLCNRCHIVTLIDTYIIEHELYIHVFNFDDSEMPSLTKSETKHTTTITYSELVNMYNVFKINDKVLYIKKYYNEDWIRGYNKNTE